MPTIQLEEVSLYYEEHGAGPPLLLLHGLGSSGQDWDYVVPQLARHYRVIVPDVRGHGRSDKPAGSYGVPLFARDVAAFCDRLGVSALHVAGVSMGGMLAFELAVTRPDLVRSLVIINSGPDMVPRTWAMRSALTMRVMLLNLLGPVRLARIVAGKLFPKPEQADLRREIEERLGKNDKDVYLRATRGLIGWSVLDRLSEIACPVLVLASDRDYTPVKLKEAYVALLKNARLVVLKDSGHAAPAENPDQVIAAMQPFFSGSAS